MRYIHLLLLLAIATGTASGTGYAASDDPGSSVVWWRAQFFAWCTGKPVTMPVPTYRNLAAVDRGCARLAQARAESRHALSEVVLSYFPYWRLDDFGELALRFSFAVCGEMAARRLGADPTTAICTLPEPRMIDQTLNLPGLYEAYLRQQIDHAGAEISPAPWTDEAKNRIAKLLKANPSASGLRRYLEKIGCRCEAISGQPARCYLTFGVLGYLDRRNVSAAATWTIAFRPDDRGAATDVEASVGQYYWP